MSLFDVLLERFGGIDTNLATVETTTTNHESRITTLEGGGVLTQYTTTGATWTKPTNGSDGQPFTADELFTIICICGGDSGAKGNTNLVDTIKGGVSGGYLAKRVRYGDLAASYTMTIGAGGAAKTSAGAPNSGGATSFGTLVVGAKGAGGEYREDGSYAVPVPPGDGGDGCNAAASPTGAGGSSTNGGSAAFAAGGRAGNGTTAGSAGADAPSGVPSGGGGGGGGSASGVSATAGGNGGFPGGGGGGGGGNQGAYGNGGAGGNGCIYVTAPH